MNNETINNGVNNNLINVQPILSNNNPNLANLNNNEVNSVPNNVIPVNNSNVVPQSNDLGSQIITPESKINNEVNNLPNNVLPVNSNNIVPQSNDLNNQIVTPEVPNNNETNVIPNNIIPTSSVIGTPVINNNQNTNIETPPNNQLPEQNFEPRPLNIESITPNNNQMAPLNNNPLPLNNNIKNINITNNNNPLFGNNSINNNIPNNQINQPTTNNNQTNEIPNQSTNPPLTDNDKEDYIKAFIGKNYDKIKELKFSIPAFFLNITYMLYRKMFLYSILLFIISLILGTIFPIATVALPIAIALLFKPLYMNFVKAKVTKIITNNNGKSKEEIINICSKKGGTSIGLIFLGGLVETIIIAIYLAIMIFVIGATFINAFIKYLPEGLENGNITIENSNDIDYSGFDYSDADY